MTTDIEDRRGTGGSGRRAAVVALLLAGTFLAAVLPLIAARYQAGRGWDDESTSHLPTIRRFAADWPRPDLRDYKSATTPGYHLVLAALYRPLGNDVRALRLAGAVFSVGLLLTLGAAVGRRVDGLSALALCLPAACSIYVLSSAVWLLPDNAGWWGVLGVLLLALRSRVDGWTYVAGGALVAALVLVRQIHLWAAGMLLVAAWVGSEDESNLARSRVRRVGAMAAALLPAVGLLAWFVCLWNGLVPPGYQPGQTQVHQGINPAVPAMVLAVAGAWGIFYAPFLLPHLDLPRRWWRWVIGAAVAAAVVAALPATSYNQAAGRWSGLWNLVRRLPVVAERSPALVSLAAVGGMVLAAWGVALERRDRLFFAAAWGGFVAAHTSNHEAWQRYYEPFVLIVFAVAASRLQTRVQRWAWAGPVGLAGVLAGIAVAGLR